MGIAHRATAAVRLSCEVQDVEAGDDYSGLVDVKGCGIGPGLSPSADPMRNGILFLHDALIELINSILLQCLFRRDGVDISTVPFYGIVHTGLRARAGWAGNELPCATLIRKALVRQPDHVELPLAGSAEEEIQFAMEAYLLSRGLTAVGPITTVCIAREGAKYVLRLDGAKVPEVSEEMLFHYLGELTFFPPQILHFVNVQIARDASIAPLRACLVDLGHIRACDELPGHLGVFVRDRQLNWGKIVSKGWPDFPLRDVAKAINHAGFGPRMIYRDGLGEDLSTWIKPIASFRPVASRLLYEALGLAMLIDEERCGSDQLIAEITSFVDRVLLSHVLGD